MICDPLSTLAFADADVQLLEKLQTVQWLKLPGNVLSASGCKELAALELPGLTLIDVSQSNIDDSGLEQLVSMKSLVNLHAANTGVSPARVSEWKARYPGLTIYTETIN